MINSPPNPTLQDVRRALSIQEFDIETAWMKMAPRIRHMQRPQDRAGTARQAGVLLLLYEVDLALTFTLTRRTDTVESHKGQISLPGGAQEPGETIEQTALRETCEELGICNLEKDIQILGHLTPLYTYASDFQIYPVIGFISYRPTYHPEPAEVAEVLEMTLPMLMDDSIKRTEQWVLHNKEVDVPFYEVCGQVLWGATAIILSEFEGRIRASMK